MEFELEVEVTDLSPNSAQVIKIDGIEVGMINVNAEGEGKLVLSSQPSHSYQGPLPSGFPIVSAGSVVTVGSSLSGVFFEHDEAQADINEDGKVGA